MAHLQPARPLSSSAPSARPCPGCELQIAADGEILIRGGNVATRGYFKQPEATARGLRARRVVPHRRHRAPRRRRLPLHHRPQEGPHRHRGRHEHRAPEHREHAQGRSVHQPGHGLRRSPAVPGGAHHREPRRAGEVRARAGDPRHAIAPASPSTRRCVERIGRTVEEKNTQLQSYAQIKKFTILPADFTPDGGELTPTLKVKRKVVAAEVQRRDRGALPLSAGAGVARRQGRRRHRRQPRPRPRDRGGAGRGRRRRGAGRALEGRARGDRAARRRGRAAGRS